MEHLEVRQCEQRVDQVCLLPARARHQPIDQNRKRAPTTTFRYAQALAS